LYLNTDGFEEECAMILKRREFLMLGAAVCAGCSLAPRGEDAPTGKTRVVSAGDVSQYAGDGVYSGFREQGFFVIRQGGRLFALSAICTHRKCKLAAESDRSFFCKCHGSTFDPGGHVTKGPARLDLPALETWLDEKGQLLVKVPD
jgi:Rieske Fe-S protein